MTRCKDFVCIFIVVAAATSGITGFASDNPRNVITAKKKGALCNFDPTTGAGNDDRAGIQAALDEASVKGNVRVQLPPRGRCYLGTSYAVNARGLQAQLIIGSTRTANAANDVVLEGNGATIYQGNVGVAILVANANHIAIRDLQFVGYAGGALNASREFDALLMVAYKSQYVELQRSYLTNSLGWTIAITGDPTVAGAGNSNTPRNVRIVGNVIKQRVGNGVVSSSGGTMSQRALQAVDVAGLTVSGNTIYGNVDLEPNDNATHDNAQHILDVVIAENEFRSGWVQPSSMVPVPLAQKWTDEPLGLPGAGVEIPQAIALAGLDYMPRIRDVVFRYNTFEYGTIIVQGQSSSSRSDYKAQVIGNYFQRGKIKIGTNTGDNVNKGIVVSGNKAATVTDMTNGFIELLGVVSHSQFTDNVLMNSDLPVIALGGSGRRGDAGNNVIRGNATLARRPH